MESVNLRRFHNVLRIKVDDQPMAATFYIEGKLMGSCVDELRRVWAATDTQNPQKQISVELSSVLLVDAAGRALLGQMYAKGAQLSGSGIMIKGLIKEIAEGKNNPGQSGFLLVPES
jgi:ABC-type transporter Mla MlaB component